MFIAEEKDENSLYRRVVEKLEQSGYPKTLVQKEWFTTQPRLILCGAGHVAREVARMASYLEFRISVIDDREEFANSERFPWAEEVICDSFEHLGQYLEEGGYYVVLTRGHLADYECVKTILSSSYGYLGMIGSRSKVQTTCEKLRGEGISEAQIADMHAPIGIPIHAHTPAEIAVSILAELIQVKNQKSCSFVSKELLQIKEKGTLCIIIEKQGSTPRGEGSMMFVGKEKIVDSIGGGAIEYAAIQDARTMEQVMVKEYQLNNSQSAELGMICGGRNKVLFVPMD